MAPDDPKTLRTTGAAATVDREPNRPAVDELELRVGACVEQFELAEPLGEGGMGVVFRALDTTLRRQVALKVMRRGPGEAENARLLREAQAMARLSHPNVVSVYQAGTVAGQVYVAMELAGDATLGDWMDGTQHGWREVVDMFLQAGRGLAAAHAAGMVHRDFKPRNVLLDDRGVARVSDFGLVTWGEPDAVPGATLHAPEPLSQTVLTRTGQAVGTPRYMSPEQHECAPVDARSDQFSFCVALWEALYGAPPFPGRTYQAIAARVVLGELEPPPENTKVPAWLHRIVARGLATDPAERFASMQPLLRALERGRTSRRRIASAAGACAIVGAAVVWFLLPRGSAAPAVCEHAAAELGEAWGEDRRAEVRRAFGGNELSWAAVEARLDEYAAQWIRSHTEACRATRVHGHQHAGVLSLRMRCLDQRRRELDAFTRLLARADDALMSRAAAAAGSLPAVAACDDLTALSAVIAPPGGAVRAQVAAVRRQLAEITALISAGLHAEGLAKVTTLVRQADATDYAPVIADTQLRLGALQDATGDTNSAARSYRRAARAADIGKHDEVRFTALLALARLYGSVLERPAAGRQLVGDARAVLRRLGKRPRAAAELLRIEGTIDVLEGHHERGLALHRKALASLDEADENTVVHANLLSGTARTLANLERFGEAEPLQARALAILQKLHGPNDLATVNALEMLGMLQTSRGQYATGLATARKVLAIKERRLPARHVGLATAYLNAGTPLERLKRYPEALQFFRRAVAVFESALGSDHPELGRALRRVGHVLTAMEQQADAVPILERALRILEARGRPGDVAHARYALARALWSSDPKRACELAGRARTFFAAAGPSYLPHTRIIERSTTTACKTPIDLERAVIAAETSRPARPDELARARFALARALWDRGQAKRACALAQQARAHWHRVGASGTNEAAAVTAWMSSDCMTRPELEAFIARNDARPDDLARARYNLARLLWTHGDKRRSCGLARHAHAHYVAAGPAGARMAAAIGNWMGSDCGRMPR